jgi:hypothetical protein
MVDACEIAGRKTHAEGESSRFGSGRSVDIHVRGHGVVIRTGRDRLHCGLYLRLFSLALFGLGWLMYFGHCWVRWC